VKKFLFILVLLLVALLQPTLAQLATERSRIIKASWQFDKKILLAELMQFDENEANAFWPLYNKYMKDWTKLINYRIYRIDRYSNDFKNMPAPAMSQFIDELFVNDVGLTRLQKKTYKKIRKVLSPVRANQFMQLEYAFQLVLLSDMQQKTMFVGDVMKKL